MVRAQNMLNVSRGKDEISLGGSWGKEEIASYEEEWGGEAWLGRRARPRLIDQ